VKHFIANRLIEPIAMRAGGVEYLIQRFLRNGISHNLFPLKIVEQIVGGGDRRCTGIADFDWN
jgi:hypothetical protein